MESARADYVIRHCGRSQRKPAVFDHDKHSGRSRSLDRNALFDGISSQRRYLNELRMFMFNELRMFMFR
jgi:hypothetical protein